MVVGTPNYMAPEQATGAELCSASDIYALGLTLYQALTGEVPLKETTAIATLSRRQRERPEPIRSRQPECPRWLDRLIRRMLEPKPRERPSASEVFKALETRRLRPRPRRQTVAATVAVLFLVVAAAAGARLLTRHPTTEIEVGKMSITGKDNRGRQTWTQEFDIPIDSDQRADIDGDGREETLLILASDSIVRSRSGTVAGPVILILRNDGTVMSRFMPEEEIVWDFDYDVEIRASLLLLDIDHDSVPEVVMVGDHQNFFPSVIFVYRVAENTWNQVLTHPGHIRNVRATPPELNPGLRFIAVNNRLGVLGFSGEILFKSENPNQYFDVNRNRSHPGLYAPPLNPLQPYDPYSWGAYVPLPLDDGAIVWSASEVVDFPDGGFELRTPTGEKVVFDSFWNPTPGPNAGKDLRALRRAFMGEIYAMSPGVQIRSPESITNRRSKALDHFADLLVEQSYRLLLDLKSARALARKDDLDAAQSILSRTVRDTGHLDSIYRLAHFEALAGDLRAGSARLIEMIQTSGKGAYTTRAGFDGPHLLLRIAIEDHDLAAIEAAIAQLSAHGTMKDEVRIGQALMARAHLWWDQLQPEDLEVTSWSYAPAGEAIACLARWRSGAIREDEIMAMNTFIERNPDAAIEGRLARTAALLGAGRSTEALDEITVLAQQLTYPSKDDFANHQLLDLARALKVVALGADGQTNRARAEARDLLPTLTPNLLPAILVSEVLDIPGRGETPPLRTHPQLPTSGRG